MLIASFTKLVNNNSHNLCMKIKKKWSAPEILFFFLFTTLVIIYSFETIGILSPTRNVNYRISTIESSVKIKNLETSSLNKSSTSSTVLRQKKIITEMKSEMYKKVNSLRDDLIYDIMMDVVDNSKVKLDLN